MKSASADPGVFRLPVLQLTSLSSELLAWITCLPFCLTFVNCWVTKMAVESSTLFLRFWDFVWMWEGQYIYRKVGWDYKLSFFFFFLLFNEGVWFSICIACMWTSGIAVLGFGIWEYLLSLVKLAADTALEFLRAIYTEKHRFVVENPQGCWMWVIASSLTEWAALCFWVCHCLRVVDQIEIIILW